MTWKGRFGLIPNLYNFYSSGEEVLENPEPYLPVGQLPSLLNPSRWAWINNEYRKGTWLISLVTHHDQGGWATNPNLYEPDFPGQQNAIWKPLPPNEANVRWNNEELQQEPFFRRFLDARLFNPQLGNAAALEIKTRGEVLGAGIPATSYAVARNEVGAFNPPNAPSQNFDMSSGDPQTGLQTGWPDERLSDTAYARDRWFHSDLRVIAYPFNNKLYKKIVNLGGLNEN